jgi:multiple sugar transport system substrate-binding protein
MKGWMKMRALLGLISILTIVACGDGSSTGPNEEANRVDAWFHSGQPGERSTIKRQIEAFNARQKGARVTFTVIPEGDYNSQVQAAAQADSLPCLLEFDGPYLYSYVWQGKLLPLDDLLPADVRKDILPTILDQGSYRKQLYSVATFDSGLGLFARRSALEAIGARIPHQAGEAWTIEEFEGILEQLAANDQDGAVLDLKLNYSGEWFSYGFSPILQSAGADLIEREGRARSGGTLNSAQAVRALTHLQGWHQRGRLDPNLDDAAFIEGRVPLSWVGHWEYPRYQEAVGDDLLLIPLPDFGQGTRTGQGSWNWGITRECHAPRLAMEFLLFLLQADQVLAMSQANGAVPGTISAIERSQLYAEGAPLSLYVEQLKGGYSVKRPSTPAYPVISSEFERAFRAIRDGKDVQEALDRAAAAIDREIADNKGYPPMEAEH